MYVQVVGFVCTFLLVAKHVLSHVGYVGGVRYSVNLVGTKGSILADFAYGTDTKNQKWRQPFDVRGDMFGKSYDQLRCHDPNVQIQFDLILSALGDKELTKIAFDCAERFGLAYNHQSAPRCFPPGGGEFPWAQFASA